MTKKGESKQSVKHQLKRSNKFSAWRVGGVFAYYNLAIFVAILLVIAITASYLPLWIYIIIVAPVLFTVFWFWFSQQVHKNHNHLSLHDALIITKISIVPFVIIFIVSLFATYISFYASSDLNWLKTLSYYGVLMGSGLVFLGLTVVFFGLRHRIRVSNVK